METESHDLEEYDMETDCHDLEDGGLGPAMINCFI